MNKVLIHIATNKNGSEIGALVASNGFQINGMEIDWSNIYPYWLGAWKDDELIGALQVLPGLPAGSLEFLSIKKTVSHQVRAIAVRNLLLTGTMTLRHHGAQVAMGTVPFDLKSYRKVLEKHGCRIAGNGNIMVKRL